MLLVQCFKVFFVVITCHVDIVNSICPLWHSVDQVSGHCECCFTFGRSGVVACENNHVELLQGNCMTWNNSTQDVEVGRCLFIYQNHYLKDPCYNYSSYYSTQFIHTVFLQTYLDLN